MRKESKRKARAGKRVTCGGTDGFYPANFTADCDTAEICVDGLREVGRSVPVAEYATAKSKAVKRYFQPGSRIGLTEGKQRDGIR